MFEILERFVVKHPDALPVPRIENIHQRVYEAASQPRALNMDYWHGLPFCDTSHCRAGWVVTLAGEEGQALENLVDDTAHAALLIYAASGYEIDDDRFYDWNEDALADMKRLAEEEAKSAGQAK
jgi:hypothetical protein